MVAASPGHRQFKDKPETDWEREAVRAIQGGDLEPFRALYNAYYERVYNQVVYLIGDELQAQDLLQSIFLKVFRGLRNFRFGSSLSTWIYRIAHNECQDFHRRRIASLVPLETILGKSDEMDSQPLSDDQHARHESLGIIHRAVMQLPLKLREVVVLRYLEDLSYGEIGSVLSCSPGTVASRLSRALEALEERLCPFRGWL
jgi:RNA polymerase sigma-70 factor (ECF subfamily)